MEKENSFLRHLLVASYDPNMQLQPGGTPLHFAANHSLESTQIFIEAGASIYLRAKEPAADLEEDPDKPVGSTTPLEWAMVHSKKTVHRCHAPSPAID